MPKKKKDDKKEKQILGRPGNAVKIGIVGLPNVGKSTLFNVLSGLSVPAENYAFCTIDPSKAAVEVPDKRWDFLCDLFNPQKRFRAVLSCWDIAGLVRGAHEGKGLGNEFLSNIAAVDAIYHCVRAFKDKKIEHVDGEIDPIRDLETISDELRKKDCVVLKSVLEKKSNLAERSNDKKMKEEVVILQQLLTLVESGTDARRHKWALKDIEFINTLNLFSAKPVVFLVNVSEKSWRKGGNKWIEPIKKWVKQNSKGSKVIPFSAAFESKVAAAEDKAAFLKEAKVPSHVQKIIFAGYKSLNLIHYFTCGEDEVKCWTIRKGTKAPAAGGVIHSDFEKGFICAETMAYDDFVECGTEAACKSAGKYVQNGKNYVVKDGDILFFKFNR